jgi:pyrroline-5-carboxylate reductase
MSVVVCIGSGNMGAALMKGACGKNGVSIFFTDIVARKAETAADFLGEEVLKTNVEGAEKGDYIFLAVKPQVLAQVLQEIKPAIKERFKANSSPVIVSMATGWSIEKIQKALEVKTPVVRMMPNTPALINEGMIVFSPSPEVPENKLKGLETMLSGAGRVDRLDEHHLNAVTGLSGSGPAYVYLFIEAMADGGVLCGLPREKALRYAAQTVMGAASMVNRTGKHPAELKDLVTTPGGTTMAGLSVLESDGVRGSIIKAVERAWKRAAELG